jgi:hypothetical protein
VLHAQAGKYLLSFKWCKKIIESNLYLNLGSTLCIFLFEIENIASSEDNFLWIIVGDIPSMYLDIHGPKSTVQVLENYIGLSQDWIDDIKAGKSIDNCYPFNAAPTIEMANLLQKRTLFMKNTLIKNIDDIPLMIKPGDMQEG